MSANLYQPFPTIFKKTKTGATQLWYQVIDGSKYRTVSGQVGGRMVTSDWTQAEGTNVGRANERTPEQQALFEMEAQRKKKLEKDYHEDQDNVKEGAHILPCMLAQSYDKALIRKNPPVLSECYSQPKLDGMRCLINKDGMWTRNGKAIVSCPHIHDALESVFIEYPNLVLDGELYNHDFKANFNEIMSIFKQLKPDAEDLQKSKQFGQFHCYDMYRMDVPSPIFSERNKFLKSLIESLNTHYVRFVRTDKIVDKAHLNALYFDDYLGDGYEGQMIREDVQYEGSRTWGLLKRKEFFDAEYELVDIESGIGNWAGKAKIATLKLENGNLFGCGITGTMEFCEELLKNKHKYIGKKTVVNYTNLTPDGVPRFGRCKEFDRMDV